MKKLYILIFVLFLYSCGYSTKINIVNNKYKNIYVEVIYPFVRNNNDLLTSNRLNNNIDFLKMEEGVVIFHFSPPATIFYNIDIYKDNTKQCLIYSKNSRDFDIYPKNKNFSSFVFILDENNKLIPISKKEFEQNKEKGIYKEIEFKESDCIKEK